MKAARSKIAPFACALLLVSPAQLWLPDQVSTPKSEVRITFSPDGKRMLWGAIGWSDGGGGWDIYESERSTSGWSKPHVVSFDSTANDFDPSFAPDGSGVYFFSNRNDDFGKDDIYFAPLTSADVVRHNLVGQIVDAYTKFDAERQLQEYERSNTARKR